MITKNDMSVSHLQRRHMHSSNSPIPSLLLLLLLFHACLARPNFYLRQPITFPSLKDALDLALLSSLIYKWDRVTDDAVVCPEWNAFNGTSFHCHWYHHYYNKNQTLEGTQVMIVSKDDTAVIVFAGTDNLHTGLTDADIFATTYGDANHRLSDPLVQVHAGFNDAVFGKGLYDELSLQMRLILNERTQIQRIFTTGHSLGAANAILTAMSLLQEYPSYAITSLNFGCPQIGNFNFMNFINLNLQRLPVWRIVLGYDLVPRLPEHFYHGGHTVQLTTNVTNVTAVAYYQHYGSPLLKLAGVPFGWMAKPFLWIPGALWSHQMKRYKSALENMSDWVHEFVVVGEEPVDDDRPLVNVDDDAYVDPPDDAFVKAVLR
jgi:hypothetical protein